MIIEAKVEGLYLGDQTGLEKTPVSQLEVDLAGVVGDKHAGFTRLADSRNKEFVRGTIMQNDRQFSVVSLYELQLIASKMGVPNIDPAWLGANLALSGVSNLTELPRDTQFKFPSGAILSVTAENIPCLGPGEVIASKFPALDIKATSFPKAAIGKRGLVGVVKFPGIIKMGDKVEVVVYKSKEYSIPTAPIRH